MKKHLYIWALSVLLLIAAAFALRLVFAPQNTGRMDTKDNGNVPAVASAPVSEKPPKDSNIVKWRVPISSQAECLEGVMWPDDYEWLVGERSGRITALTPNGGIQWQVTHSNNNWQSLVSLRCDVSIVAVSFQGTVCLLEESDGSIRWMRKTDGTFMHAPRFGKIGDTRVLYLLSQSDSTIFCLRLDDGELLWQSEPSNRCDGRPEFWGDKLVFGNCDGVVYVVDANTGQTLGTIETGGQSDPMASEMVAVTSGLVTGTYLGNFLLLDPETMTLLDNVKIADSEAFATPVYIGDATVAMGTPDGRISLWDTRERKLQSKGEIHVNKDGIDEMVFDNEKKLFWVLAGRTLNRVCLENQDVQTYNIGDNMKSLTVNPWGEEWKLVLLADGDVVCLDLDTVAHGVPAVQKGKTE